MLRLRVPRVLSVTVVSLAAGCTDPPEAPPPDAGACQHPMAGRVCVTTCRDFDIDGGAPYACEVYCDTARNTCVGPTGAFVGCNVIEDGARTYAIC